MKIEEIHDESHLRTVEARPLRNGTTCHGAPLDGMSIFLAEDEFINQYMLSSFLKENGALVTLCGNGLELLLALEKSRPDVILTDIRMPVMDGLEAVRQIRESEFYLGKGRVPIIALTAHGTQGYDVISLAAGMDEYFTKPLDLDRLTSAILSLSKRREYAPI